MPCTILWIPNPAVIGHHSWSVMKTSDKWEIDWALELIKWEWIKSWCESALPLQAFRAPFRLLLFGPLPSDNTGILGTVFLCSQTPQTYQKPLLKSDPLIYASAASLRVEHLCARDIFNISSKNKTEGKKQNVKNTTQGSVFSWCILVFLSFY